MNEQFDNITEQFSKLKNRKDFLEKDKIVKQEKLSLIQKKYDNLFKARWVLSQVNELTQKKFKDRVEKLITSILQSVFNKDITFELIYEQKRNKTECRPVLKENGNEFSVKDERGGSLVDLISFAFRIVLWSMQNPRSRNVFILDEPFRMFGGEMFERIGGMLKELSSRLNIQFIMISHNTEFASIADKTFKINQNNGISYIGE